jgi:DNA-nicking Smr family endonuclease
MAKKNKNKIKILDSNQDLNDLFGYKPESEPDKAKLTKNSFSPDAHDLEPEISEKEFEELLDNSLKGKSMDKMMQEKKERGAPKKVPLSRRLKRYPPSESRLDLHGFTSTGAVIKADSYIRTAFRTGLFTLKIIVGKGIHSEFGAVLPDVIQDLLLRLKTEGIVLHFAFEKKKKKTKSGAILVYLNQFNDLTD